MIELLLASMIYELPRPQVHVPNNVPGCYIVDSADRMIDLSVLCGGEKAVTRLTCEDFATREEAQAAFDAKTPGTERMDADGDLQVCEWKR